MKKKKIYYAHAIWLYETKTEQEEIRSIRSEFPQYLVVNPSELERPEDDAGNDEMEFFKEHVSRCDVLVFSRLAWKITAGVGLEVNHALSNKKPVFELKGGEFIRTRSPVKYLTREETRELFSKLPPPGFLHDD